jgi:hypothetical protein
MALSASILNIPPKPRLTYRSFQLLFALKTHKNNHEIGHYLTLSPLVLFVPIVMLNCIAKRETEYIKPIFSLTLLNYLVNSRGNTEITTIA